MARPREALGALRGSPASPQSLPAEEARPPAWHWPRGRRWLCGPMQILTKAFSHIYKAKDMPWHLRLDCYYFFFRCAHAGDVCRGGAPVTCLVICFRPSNERVTPHRSERAGTSSSACWCWWPWRCPPWCFGSSHGSGCGPRSSSWSRSTWASSSTCESAPLCVRGNAGGAGCSRALAGLGAGAALTAPAPLRETVSNTEYAARVRFAGARRHSPSPSCSSASRSATFASTPWLAACLAPRRARAGR